VAPCENGILNVLDYLKNCTVLEVTQVRYGPTFLDIKTHSKLVGKYLLGTHVGTYGALGADTFDNVIVGL
jgi:hypothetical protein